MDGHAERAIVGGGHGVAAADVDERTLVHRVQRDGDMEAFGVLYRRHVDAIHGFAYRRSGSSPVADDVTSSTFERALRRIDTFRWRAAGLRPWLMRIASNELVTHYRAEARGRTDRALGAMHALSESSDDDPSDAVLSGAEADRLRAAMDELNPRYQRAIALRYLAGLSNRDAAAAMGVSTVNMAVTLHRALGALRKVID